MDRKATPDDMADGDDTYSTDSNIVRKLNSKRYELTFKAGDETAILQDGEFSEDELRLKELYASGLASQRSSPGVTWGLDELIGGLDIAICCLGA